MHASKTAVLAIATSASIAIAQSSSITYNNSQITVQGTNKYANTSLVGYHTGAGLSFMVARAGSGNQFAFNTSATSKQLLNNNIAAGYQLACYVINDTAISDNAGPLQCGVGDLEGFYDVASLSTAGDGSPVTIDFDGIDGWSICTVQSGTYGWIQGTVVGSFGTDVPSGPGIQNCTAIDGIAFAGGDSYMMPSNMTVPSNSSMTASVTPPYPTNPVPDPAMTESKTGGISTVTITAPCTSTAVVPTPSLSPQPQMTTSPSASTPVSPTPSSPIAPYTGAASTIDSSAWIGLVLAVLAFQL